MTAPPDRNPPTAETKNALGSPPSPLDSIDDMRSAAKWMLAAAGAVGATLISGGSLVAIGKVHGGLNIFLAVLGLVSTVGGIGIAIWFTSEVLVPRLTTPAMFLMAPELKNLREIINAEPGEFFSVATASRPADAAPDTVGEDDAAPVPAGATANGPAPAERLPERLNQLRRIASELLKHFAAKTPDEPANPNDPVSLLFKRQEELRQNTASLVRQSAAENDPQRREQYQKQLRRVEESGERVGASVRYVLDLGATWRIKAALQRARIATMAGALLVIAGASLFFFATASSGPTYVPVMTTSPTPPASPTAAPRATVTP